MPRYLIGNWKMNVPPEGVERYLATISGVDPRDVEIVVAPPFPFLRHVVRCGQGTGVAGQNCSDQASGAYTGEVSPVMLRECGVQLVILGHSERRNLFHENDALIARKLALAIGNGLTPILCIGEDLRVRETGRAAMYLADQIKASAVPELDSAGGVILAYEPVWAIGTGQNASGPMIAETMVDIRSALQRFWPARAGRTPIVYGGSVTPDNVGDLVEHGTIDGFLVGGASLDSRKFLAIHRALG